MYTQWPVNSFTFIFLSLFIQYSVAPSGGIPCPSETPNLRSSTLGNGNVKISFHNKLSDDVFLIWVSFSGEEKTNSIIGGLSSIYEQSYPGHVYRVRTTDDQLLLEHVIDEHDDEVNLDVKACGDVKEATLYNEGEDVKFRSLVLNNSFDCEPLDDSSQWSCIRKVSKEEEASRIKDDWGFHSNEVRGGRRVHQVKDDTYVNHIPLIPSLTSAGYLLMEQTDKMKKCLNEWWNEHHDDATVHEPISGDYTNLHVHKMTKLNLDHFPHIRKCIVVELKKVMQWWVGRKLKHTSTFGMRIYHRDAMLINHVDRYDTHLASAVIQIVQEGVDSGWPLEVATENGLHEVYLQPGQMVLYEGARFFHGRPMRFKGETFGNIFSHFAPLDWHGPYSNRPEWAKKSTEANGHNEL